MHGSQRAVVSLADPQQRRVGIGGGHQLIAGTLANSVCPSVSGRPAGPRRTSTDTSRRVTSQCILNGYQRPPSGSPGVHAVSRRPWLLKNKTKLSPVSCLLLSPVSWPTLPPVSCLLSPVSRKRTKSVPDFRPKTGMGGATKIQTLTSSSLKS